MANLDPAKLSFRTYLRRRSTRYRPVSMTAVSKFLTALFHDDDFAALHSREELDAYLALHECGPNGSLLAHTVWNSYLIAKNRLTASLIAAFSVNAFLTR